MLLLGEWHIQEAYACKPTKADANTSKLYAWLNKCVYFILKFS